MSSLSLTVDAEPSFLTKTANGFQLKTLKGFGVKNYRIVKETDNFLTYFNFSVDTTLATGLGLVTFSIPFSMQNFSNTISTSYPLITDLPNNSEPLLNGIYKLHSISNTQVVRENPAQILVGEKYMYGELPNPIINVEFFYYRIINLVSTWVDYLGNPMPDGSINGTPPNADRTDSYPNLIQIFISVDETPNIIYVGDTVTNNFFSINPTETYTIGPYVYEITLSPVAVKRINFIAYLRVKNSSGIYLTTITNFNVPSSFQIVNWSLTFNGYYKFEIQYTGDANSINFKIT